MSMLTAQKIAQYRSQLADYPVALAALAEIEACEGDLEDAAINLAISAGQQPDRANWLDSLAKRCRVGICQTPCQQELANGNLIFVVDLLIKAEVCPAILVTPVVIYVIEQGVSEFCSHLSLKLNP